MWMAMDGRLYRDGEAVVLRRDVFALVLSRHGLPKTRTGPVDEAIVLEAIAIDRALTLATLSRMVAHG